MCVLSWDVVGTHSDVLFATFITCSDLPHSSNLLPSCGREPASSSLTRDKLASYSFEVVGVDVEMQELALIVAAFEGLRLIIVI